MVVRISLASAIFNATLFEAIFYGAYVVIFVIAMVLLLTRTNTRLNLALTTATLVMFLLSSAHIAMVLQYANTQYLDKDAALYGDMILQRRGDPMVYVPTVLEIINCYIADAIVFWRAWVLWGKTSNALAIPLALWLASIAEGLAVMHALAVDAPGEAASLAATTITTWTVAFAATTCFSNFWAVCMIGYRYYIYHKEVVVVLGRRRASYRTILVLIIESGLLYCLSWLLFIIVYMSGSRGMYIMFHLLAQLTGIYPTMIIVLVCLRLTQQDDMDNFHASIRFATASVAYSGSHPTCGGRPPPSPHTVDISMLSCSHGCGVPDGKITELADFSDTCGDCSSRA
ncbi:hypothetical protein BC835DRAFT_1414831 [Cytidiella melzeri]|nr:hypothetical protein BC835DRAFT_1414831 [Cytidiella melzeri]